MARVGRWSDETRVSAGWLLLGALSVFFVQGCGSLPTTTDAPAFQRGYGDFAYCPIEAVRQSTPYTCGPACLASVLTYWDKETSEREIVAKYPSSGGGTYYLVELRAIAEAEALKAYVFAMDAEPRREVEEQVVKGRPLICAVRVPRALHLFDGVPLLGGAYRRLAWALNPRKDHFVVVAGLKPEQVLVMDPAYGFTAFPWHRFEGAWSQMKYACLLVSN